MKLAIRLDGAAAPDGTLRLGANGTAAGGAVDLADSRLVGTPPDPPAASTPAVTVELWRASAAADGAPAPVLDDATRERLRQLGYVE